MDAGITLIKTWLEVGQRRFDARINDPLRQWKLSPMDVESFQRSIIRARAMLKATDTKHAPWSIVRTDDKRLNCISHILAQISYKKISKGKVKLPKRSTIDKYDDQASLKGRNFVVKRY